MSRPLRALAAGLVLVAAGCGDRPRTVHRLDAPGTAWQRCPASRDPETQLASWCPRPRLLAAAVDVDAARAVASLPADLGGPLVLTTEVERYDVPPADAFEAQVLPKVPDTLAHALRDDSLARSLAPLPALHARGTRTSAWHDGAAPSLALALGSVGPDVRSAWAVWGWPPPRGRDEVALSPFTPPDDARLVLAFAVAAPGESPGSPPVTFRVVDAAGTELWRRTLDPARRAADRGWLGAEVALGRRAGRAQALRLVADVADGRVSYPLWGRPALAVPARATPPPNVILVSLDTVRFDHLSLSGYPIATTPGLDAFAAEGAVFTNAFSTFPSTTASHMSMLTSLHPCVHGAVAPGEGNLVLPAAAHTVTQAFADAGYSTLAITEDALIKGDQGFDRGFDRYVDQIPQDGGPLGLFAVGIARALDWIDALGSRRFFLFLHTYQPHIPYKVPAHVRPRFPVPPDATRIEHDRIDYDAGLVYTDELLSGLLRALRDRRLLEDTLVVIVSDHGTEFGEHGGLGHALGVFDEQLHVPLVLHAPALVPAGVRVATPVSLVDLAPTLLDLAGVPRPASFAGTSLRPLLAAPAGDPPAGAAPSPVFGEQLWGSRQTLLRTADTAWITTTAGTALYDLRTDPGEHADLAPRRPREAAAGAARIVDFRHGCDRRREALRAGAAGERDAPLSPERAAALRALGYLK